MPERLDEAAPLPPLPPESPSYVARRRTARVRLGALVLLFVAVIAGARALGLHEYLEPARLAASIHSLRGRDNIAPLFVAAYGLGNTLGLPAAPFTLAGGAIFGVALGIALNWIGALAGAVGSYFLARWLGHGALAEVIRRRAPRLDALVSEGGFGALLRLRLIPIVPFNALSIGAGLAGVRPLPYVAATAIGILPAVAAYTVFADALLEGAEGARQQAFMQAGIAGLALVALSFLPSIFARFTRR